jgi:predicted nucleotidyltransferase
VSILVRLNLLLDCSKGTPMRRDEAISILRQHAGELRTLGVASLALFGSTARDQAGEDSDVDLLVEFSRPVGLFDVFRLQHRLEGLLAVSKVDLVQRGAEHPALRDSIYEDAIHVA